MTKNQINKVIEASHRFVALAQEVFIESDNIKDDFPLQGTKLTGKLRRLSMDFSDTLIELRKPAGRREPGKY